MRRAVRDTLVKTYRDCRMEGEDFDVFVHDMARLLPASVPFQTLYDSVRHLAGELLTQDALDLVAWRLAGNLHTLKRHKPAYPWSGQTIMEWVPAQVHYARRRRSGRGDLGWAFGFKILAGTPTGLLAEKFWSDKFARYMSGSFGFSRRRPSDRSSALPRYQFQHPTEFVTLRTVLLVDPKLCGREPGFEKTKFPPSALEWNREQLRYRDRIPVPGDSTDYNCPFGMNHTVQCFQCLHGFKTCRVGTHRLDYVFDYCTYCSRDKAPFDHDLSTEMCAICHEKRSITRK